VSEAKNARRGFLRAAGAGAAAVVFGRAFPAGASDAADEGARRPNLVLFLSDDHGWADSGCYGNRQVRTPNLDRLASEGMRLTHAFAGSPTCTPSRSVIYTGLMPLRNGAHGNHSAVRAEVKSLPTYLGKLGYRVVLAGKTHIRPRESFPFEYVAAHLPRDPAADRRYRAEGLDTRAVDKLLAAHAAARPRRPLCLVLGESAPHVMWQPNRGYDPAELALPPYVVDTPATRAGMARYFSEITTMDKRLGECLASLRRHGLADETVFLYASDQGPEWPHAKWNLYDAGIRCPLVVRWPGRVRPGSVCDAMVSFADLTPTLVDLGGGAAVEGLDGRSFLPALLGRTDRHRDEVYAAHTGDGNMNDFPMRAVRTRTHKYILNLKPGNRYTTHFSLVADRDHGLIYRTWVEKAKTDEAAARLVRNFERRPAEELYDLRADPHELSNLAGDPACRELLESLRGKVRQWMAQQGDKGLAAPTAGPPGGQTGSREKRFQLAQGDELAGAKAPHLPGRAVTITATIRADRPDGVLVAQGGNIHGLALYVKDGRLHLAVRRDRELTTVGAPDVLPAGRATVKASLAKDGAIALEVAGRKAASGKAPGALTGQPGEPLRVGADTAFAVGDYTAPGTFRGTIERVLIELGD